jgi:hypothetical protein
MMIVTSGPAMWFGGASLRWPRIHSNAGELLSAEAKDLGDREGDNP